MKRHYLELLLYKAQAELRAEAARSYLGVIWWVLEPLLYMAVFYFVFAILRGTGEGNYVAFLLTGLVAWKWFASTISQGSGSILSNAPLIRQVYLPKYIFPFISILSNFVKFLFVFALLLAFLLLSGTAVTKVWLAIPVLVVMQLLVMAAIATFLSSIVPLFPDLRLIIDNALMLLFFLSGIFFDVNSISAEMRPYLFLNPMVTMIESFRAVLIENEWPEWNRLFVLAIASVIVLLIALAVIKRLDRVYPKIILR